MKKYRLELKFAIQIILLTAVSLVIAGLMSKF